MALKIDYSKVKGKDVAYGKVKALITPEYIQKFQVKADVDYDDTQKKIIAKGKGFTLTLCFFETHCEADLELSLLLRALKSKILEKIEHQVAKNL